MYLLDYILPQVYKLSKTLQKENLDLSIISSLVDATLHTLEDVLLPAANWVLDLLDVKEEMSTIVGINFNSEDITSFQRRVTEPFHTKLKENIQNRFISQDVVSCFSIFDPKKTPNPSENCSYGNVKLNYSLSTMGLSFQLKQLKGMNF